MSEQGDEFAVAVEAILRDRAHKNIGERVTAIVAAFEEEITPDPIWSIETVGAHIDVETITYPGGSVSLDAAGNMVRADFDVECMVVDE